MQEHNSVLVPLTKGFFAVIDSEDAEAITQFKWKLHSDKQRYASRTQGGRADQKTVLMHRVLMGDPRGILIDHKDGDKLNNRKSNLRRSDEVQNSSNRRPHNDNKTGFKGVSWSVSHGKWQAGIMAKGRNKHLGFFDDVESAASAYNDSAKLLHGEFAWLNTGNPNGELGRLIRAERTGRNFNRNHPDTMIEPTPTACPVCREPVHGHHSECPGMQTGGAMLDALLATRQALDDLLELHGQAVFKIDACDLEEARQAIEKCAAVLKWPKIPLP